MFGKGETETYPLVEEKARIEKRKISTGRVRVRTVMESATEFAGADLEEQTVQITRVPINKVVNRVPPIRTEAQTTIIPVMEEVLVVEKQLLLKEELHVRRQVSADHVEVPITIHKQRAVVERLTNEAKSNKLQAEKEKWHK